MRFHLRGDISRLAKGLELLTMELDVNFEEGGVPIEIIQSKGPIEVSYQDGHGKITYEKPIHFYRAFGLFLEHFQKGKAFSEKEVPQFTMNGIMLDVSRNAVMKVEEVHSLLRKMALMGLDTVMLYTEDTYEIKEYPYFGYMRGRYTEEELKVCDDYAHALGIEMIPCIQTLAHLKEALKWNYASDIQDTDDILLAGEEKTYHFIKDMITSASRPFRTSRIHIGMDEAHALGLGKYLEKNGYQDRFSIMNAHLKEVVAITDELELHPMIWSDMYFRLGSKTGGYYDLEAEIPQEVMDAIPANLQLVYWDYYHTDENFYQTFIEKHQEFGADPIFAGGVWTWNGIAPNYGLARKTTDAALSACKQTGVKEVFATMWGDNGAETPMMAAIAGLQLFAEHGYSREVDPVRLAERFRFCTGGEWEDFLLLNEFDETPGVMENNLKESHSSKFLLWQDVLIGLYDANIEGLPMNEHYQRLTQRLEEAKKRNPGWSTLFAFYHQLAKVLSVKAEIGIHLKKAYDAFDKDKIASMVKQLGDLREDVEVLRRAHRKLWLDTNKAFGWEVLDIRYGGVITRLDTADDRLTDWLDGNITKIEELEEERLYHDAPWKMPEGALGRNVYHRIVTASTFSG
ncbi:family 20 glycosylhydrolase [Thalassobacillus pellis]|uniref:family 20 glycosylhydrolase n=1 Tax=Thalassobacillus pellis TaxID=748008 RepID=UPI001960E4DD|nr:family 20 glycosylhydrolase [Thalassobacillus pellis]MBM7551546.1 hypothetical protein [Thalassobacillus pellis]